MHPPVDRETAEFIHRLPKTETHLHLEGAVPFHLLRELDPEKYAEEPECWRLDFKWPTFEEFNNHLLSHAIEWFTSPERYHRAAEQVFQTHLEQNVRYVETSFHAGIIEFLGIPGPEILDAIRSAVPDGLEVRVFMGMTRDSYNETLAPVLEACMAWEGLAGLDLHGIETLPLEDWTPRLWQKARDHGLETKAHAGEFGPAENVREAVRTLGVRRVQHGVRAREDEDVMRFLEEHSDVTLEVCPISNIKLAVMESLQEHPIRTFFDRGIRCTVSTDDPFSFGNRVEDEYAALNAGAGFTRDELKRIARNGFEVALVDDATRDLWLAELDAVAV